jgi:hypothetical protein
MTCRRCPPSTAVSRGETLARALYLHANMNIAHPLAAAAVLATITLAPAARAEDAPLLGLSVDAFAAPTLDHSITDQQTGLPHHASRGTIGLATLLNWDELALGGVLDGMPGIFGDGRLSIGALAGWQPRLGGHRYQLLGELGQERFSDVGGNLFSTPSTQETWLGYVGARLGISETFSSDGPFELGAWLFFRKDVSDATVSNTAGAFVGGGDANVNQYHLGGYSGGVGLRVGLRFDQRRAASDSTVEPAYEPVKS